MDKGDSKNGYVIVAFALLILAIVLMFNPFQKEKAEHVEKFERDGEFGPAIVTDQENQSPPPEVIHEPITYETVNDDEVFDVVENEPEFVGGEQAMQNFIKKNIRYPEMSIQMGDQGKVFVKFVIEKDGRVNHITVARGVTPELDKEAVRVITKMPKWKPGIQRGKPVRTNVIIPIVFRLA